MNFDKLSQTYPFVNWNKFETYFKANPSWNLITVRNFVDTNSEFLNLMSVSIGLQIMSYEGMITKKFGVLDKNGNLVEDLWDRAADIPPQFFDHELQIVYVQGSLPGRTNDGPTDLLTNLFVH